MSRSTWKRGIAAALALVLLLVAAFTLGIYVADSQISDPIVPPWPPPAPSYMQPPTPNPFATVRPSVPNEGMLYPCSASELFILFTVSIGTEEASAE